jgi:hypothetical protein
MELHGIAHGIEWNCMGIGTGATQDDTPEEREMMMKNKTLFSTTPVLNDNVTPSTAA